MRAWLLQWVVCLGLVGAVRPSVAPVVVPRQLSLASVPLSSSEEDAWKIRPIKKRVGRAVTPTMDKIDNIWFVISQILLPLSAIIFSVIYVRRYRVRHAAADPLTSDDLVADPDEQPASANRDDRQ